MSLQPITYIARLTLATAFGFVVLLAHVAAVASRPAEAPRFTLVKTGRPLDVKAGAVPVEGERIKLVGALVDVQSQVPADTRVIDPSSSTVLPGLIDCHTHLLDERWVAMNFYEGAAIRILQGRQARQALSVAAAGRHALQVGFTTVCDTRGQGDLLVFDAYVRAGLPPIEIIRMAMVNAAELLGREESIGTIEPGTYADLIVVAVDPLRDAGELKRVNFVMKSGAVVDLKGRYTVLPEASKRRA